MALRNYTNDSNVDLLAISLLVFIYLSGALMTLPTTGVTWDENRYIAQGKARAYSLYSIATGNPDLFFCDINRDFETDPDLSDENAEWASRCWEGRPKLSITLSGLTWAGTWFLNGGSLGTIESISAHRLAIVFLTALGIAVAYLFVGEAFGRRAGILASLSMIFMPRLFEHSKYVLMDEPVGILWLITIWLFWKGLKDWRYGVLSGAFFGFALATKAQSIFIPVVLFFWILIAYRDRVIPVIRGILEGTKRKLLIPPLSFVLLTPLVWFASWPWLWANGAERFKWWIGYYLGSISSGPAPAYFMGEIITRPTFIYIFSLAGAVIPVPMLIFTIYGAMMSVSGVLSKTERVSFLLLLSALTPMVVLSISTVAYNGVQQYIQSFVFIALIAGIGTDGIIKKLIDKRPGLKKSETLMTAFFAALIILPGALAIFSGHTGSYFNSIVGGPGGVHNSGLYETTWSGEPYLETVRWLNMNIEKDSVLYIPLAHNIFNTYRYGDIGQIPTRFNTSSASLGQFSFEQEPVLRKDITIISYQDAADNPDIMDDVDYIVLMTRFSFYGSDVFINSASEKCLEAGEPVHSVTLDGAPLVWVFETPCGGS